MKRIGLLGGMSWESSIEYERLINHEVRRRLGGTHSGDLVIRSYDFAAIEELQERGAWDEAGQLLADDAVHLENAGAAAVLEASVELLVGPEHVRCPYFPTTHLHAMRAVDLALA